MLVGSVTDGPSTTYLRRCWSVPPGRGAALVEPDATERITVKHEEET